MLPDKMVGQIIGHYRIVRPLGYGGSATVFLAEDIHLQREVALKVFRSRVDDTGDFLRRFAREARVLAQLDHPNILPVYDYGEQGELAYLVMPHMVGGSLRDRLNKQKLLPKAEVVQLLSQALKALQYAHDHGLIHRDIKPGNMLFKADGTLLLSDFGLVKIVPNADDLSTDPGESMSMTVQSISGTPYYMSPEQINGKAEPLTDIYAMGIVLYEMLAGEQPFQADNFIGILMKHLYEQPRPIHTLNPLVSPALAKVVTRAMAKEAGQRYQHPEEMRQALLQALDSDQAAMVAPADPFQYSIQDRLTQSPAQTSKPGSRAPTNTPLPVVPFSYVDSPIANDKTINFVEPVQPFRQVYIPPKQQVQVPERPRSSHAPLIISILLIILILITSVSTVLYLNGAPLPGLPTRGRHLSTILPTTPDTRVKVNPTNSLGTTLQVPSTSTACPAAGAGQAAVTAPIVTGTDQNIIYMVNESKPIQGTIKRKDATTGADAVEIQKMVNVVLLNAQISNDGHWVLFTAKVGDHEELRMIRIDGQGLQTLYCTAAQNSIYSTPQWSLDQKHIIFAISPPSGPLTTYLLDSSNGSIQAEVLPSTQSNRSFVPRLWLDDRYVYMVSVHPNSDAPLENVYVLDTYAGPPLQESNLLKVINAPLSCLSFDTSYDLTQLIVGSCNTNGQKADVQGTPSQITIQPTPGGPTKTIFSSSALAITMVRAVSSTMLLLQVENNSGDSSQNGLWKLYIDGTGLTRLTTDSNGAQSLCQFSQYAWSNVSRDGTMFALQYYDPQKSEYALSYGQLAGGTLNQYADISDGTTLQLAGWTNM